MHGVLLLPIMARVGGVCLGLRLWRVAEVVGVAEAVWVGWRLAVVEGSRAGLSGGGGACGR